MQAWWIGCSGFHYPEWKKIFYPEGLPQRKWFDYYSERFNSIEVNGTFYKFPQLPFLQNWYDKSPSLFTFSVKVPRAITHFKQFRGTEQMLASFYETCRNGLKDKLGCILFQLPSRVSFTREKLQEIISAIDPSFSNVLEFRHETWWTKEVYDTLAANNITFCSMSHPSLPDQVVVNTPIVYYRFHGVPHIYKSQYPKKAVEKVIDQIITSTQCKTAYVYFNNTMGIAGIRNAKQTQEKVRSTKY